MGRQVDKVVKYKIARRDHWTCCFCGEQVTDKNWSLEHLVPRCLGGSCEQKNMKIAHAVCNNNDARVLERHLKNMRSGLRLRFVAIEQERYFYV